MHQGEYKKVLLEIFDVLGLSEEEKEVALESFKKKLSAELLNAVKGDLPVAEQDWVNNQKGTFDPDDSHIAEIQQSIKKMYSDEQLYQKSRGVFKTILKNYASYMAKEIEPETAVKITQIVDGF